jgi:hypothetical protein
VQTYTEEEGYILYKIIREAGQTDAEEVSIEQPGAEEEGKQKLRKRAYRFCGRGQLDVEEEGKQMLRKRATRCGGKRHTDGEKESKNILRKRKIGRKGRRQPDAEEKGNQM